MPVGAGWKSRFGAENGRLRGATSGLPAASSSLRPAACLHCWQIRLLLHPPARWTHGHRGHCAGNDAARAPAAGCLFSARLQPARPLAASGPYYSCPPCCPPPLRCRPSPPTKPLLHLPRRHRRPPAMDDLWAAARRGPAGLPLPARVPDDPRAHRVLVPPHAAPLPYTSARLPTMQAQLPPLQLHHHHDAYNPDQSLPPLREVFTAPSSSTASSSSHAAAAPPLPHMPTPPLFDGYTAYPSSFRPIEQPVAQYYHRRPVHGLLLHQQQHIPDSSRPYPQPAAPRRDYHHHPPTSHQQQLHAPISYIHRLPGLQQSYTPPKPWNTDSRPSSSYSSASESPTTPRMRDADAFDSTDVSPSPHRASPIINQAILRVQPQIPAALGKATEDGNQSDPRVSKKRKTIQPEKPLKRPKVCTKLGAKRPVRTFVPIDIWLQIFRFVEPKQLFEMRTVCHEFYNCLKNKQMPWRECRIAFFGKAIPPPPDGLKFGREEQMYMDLLAGHTQSCMSCGTVDETRKARKVYWAFLRRWCETCFKEKTVNVGFFLVSN